MKREVETAKGHGFTRRTFLTSAVSGLIGGSASAALSGCRVFARPDVSLTAFKYGQSTLPESMVFRNGSGHKRIPISFLFYMIELPGRRILVDTGCDTMPGFKMEHFIRPVDLLKRYGIAPGDISDVVITHAHHDHIGAVSHFRSAEIHIQKDEARAGAKYLKGLKVTVFDREKTVAPHVTARKIGGHSIGSSILILDFNRRPIVLAGDECYVRECLLRKIPTGASHNPAKSEEFIRTYSSGEYEVHLYHDYSTLPGENGKTEIPV